MAQWVLNRYADLRNNIGVQCVGQARAVRGESNAHTWRVTVIDGMAAANLDGYSAQCSYIRPDGGTIYIDGSISGNVAEIVFPAACYAYVGTGSAILRLINNAAGVNVVIDGLMFTIDEFETDVVIDPGNVVPSLSELLAQMDAMRTATETADGLNTDVAAAEALRLTAEAGRVASESTRVANETARISAENLRASAETARLSAENGRASAESGRVSAETARASAESSRASAETARASAEAARVSAENARVEAENARVAAEEIRAAFYDGFSSQLAEKTSYGVLNGLVVAAQATPDMTVKVSAGVAYMSNNTRFAPAAVASLAVTAADATNPRIDIVYLSSAGVVSYLAGTAAATPAAPATPTGGLLLAEISVAAGATSIVAASIALRKKKLWVEDWITPTLLNGWVETNGTPQYMKDAMGFVHFRGCLNGASSTANLAMVMPVGYRPGVSTYFSDIKAEAFAVISTSGDLSIDNTKGWAALSQISYLAEA